MSDFQFRVLTSEEAYIINGNVQQHTALLKSLPNKCGVPDCNYPLRQTDDNYRLADFGDVCMLCFTMYHALMDRAYWIGMHRLWLENGKKKEHEDE